MSFPTITLKAMNLEISPGLSALIDQKLQTLGKLLPPNETDIRCEVEMEKSTEHQTGKIFRVEVNLYVAGVLHRAEACEDQIEKSIDVVRDELKRELQRASGKRQSLVKRGGKMIKDMMRFGK